MLLSLDFGHTALKAAVTDLDGTIRQRYIVPHGMGAGGYNPFLVSGYTGVIFTSGEEVPDSLVGAFASLADKFVLLDRNTPLPIQNNYQSPDTLGYDRLAAAVGAWKHFPNQNSFVVDAGTCINYEWIRWDGYYMGGAISPGLRMRFKAMHTFTGNLPLVEPDNQKDITLGTDTASCLNAGVLHGMTSEIEGFIQSYEQMHGYMNVLLTGGDAPFFENRLKNNIFARPDLVTEGLIEILRFNL